MARPDKAAAVAELSERFSRATGVVLTEYRGLTVKALGELRRSLGEDATYTVSKNTLTTIAAREAGVEGIEDQLVGPTAIAFISGDPVNVAKGLRDFGRTNPLLIIKGGVLEGRVISPENIRQLADLESREVLLAKVAGGMQGILQQAISLISAPLSQVARLAAALQQAAEENPSLLAAEPNPEPAAATDTSEPTDTVPATETEDVSELSDAEPAATEAVVQPSTEELAAPAVTAAPAAPSAEISAEDTTTASAANDQ